MTDFYKKHLTEHEAMTLVKEKKAHMFIMLVDSTKISRKAIIARVQNAFNDLINRGLVLHTWFMGED